MVDLNLRRTLFGGNDIAIDLGTANTLIYVKGVGVVVDEPTLLAVNKSDKSIITIGREAKKLIGRVPEKIELVRPLRDGVISEIEMAEELVKTLLSRAIGRAYSRPRIVICVPNGVTSVEQRSIETAAHATGASEVFTIEEPMAAAIGSGLNIFEPYGNMIVDIGGGTTEIAVISMGDIVNAKKEKTAEISMRDYSEEEQDRIQRYRGSEELQEKKQAVFVEGVQDERDYESLTGRKLITPQTVKGRTYTPTSYINYKDLLKEEQSNLADEFKDIK